MKVSGFAALLGMGFANACGGKVEVDRVERGVAQPPEVDTVEAGTPPHESQDDAGSNEPPVDAGPGDASVPGCTQCTCVPDDAVACAGKACGSAINNCGQRIGCP